MDFITPLCLDAQLDDNREFCVLTIDLRAIQQNWLKLNSLTRSCVGGVIKANAYGLGAKEVANCLFAAGCKEFFLATLDEAVEARSCLPSEVNIYLLGGLRNVNVSELHERNITPVLCSGFDIERWSASNSAYGCTKSAALKINTGMTRFGLDKKEFHQLCESSEKIKAINPTLLISHLSCADDPSHLLNKQQCERFDKSLSLIKKVRPLIRASLANSSGIFLGESWHFDLLRPGAALYGVNPTATNKNPMYSVVQLALPVLQVRTLEIDESIGYAATAHLPSGARIAVVSGGYADGVHRTLGASRDGVLLGHVVKVIGRISMDSMIFDISHLPHSDDEIMRSSVEIIGASRPLDVLINNNQSLGYEVLTSLGARYKRKYLPGDV
ncbi:alanine racemase [Cellvibrio sp. pealriver]|uniref:alanine racemase n=1 Tax=Cellvibrio sp. pealriver TaxID=1622269 RepID=UPI00066FC956|nr:alanine racemase [Cellvibrio sp. pealriver]